MSFLEPIGQLLQYVWDLIPKPYLIACTHEGIKFVKGKPAKKLVPKMYWYWPLTTQMWSAPVVRQAIKLKSQPLCTKDLVPVSVSAIVVFEISDIMKFGAKVWDGEETVGEVAEAAIPRIVTTHTLAELQVSLQGGDVGREMKEDDEVDVADQIGSGKYLGNPYLTKSMKAFLRSFGVKVLYAAFTGLAPTQVIHVTGMGGPILPVASQPS
ncbi:MAG: SPFH domain-containing protein [Patescibacteria group bacterium]